MAAVYIRWKGILNKHACTYVHTLVAESTLGVWVISGGGGGAGGGKEGGGGGGIKGGAVEQK